MSLWRLGEERLDWQAFLARFFPDSRRHDFDALAAYESYRNDLEGRPADGAPAPVLDRAMPAAAPETELWSEDEEEPPATTDTARWEADGGASAGRRRRRRRGERPIGTQSPE